MTKKVCFIHTDTTGLHEITGEKITKKNLYGFARMVTLSWIIAYKKDDEYIVEKKQRYIIKPRCMHIPESTVQYHGITQEIAENKGVDIEYVFDEFAKDIAQVRIIISHSLEFHMNTIQSELVRYNKPINFSKYLLIDINSFNHAITPATLTNIYTKICNKNIEKKSKTIDAICELFFKLYNNNI
jgi:DNA polymerase III epsilon subunit-like protein